MGDKIKKNGSGSQYAEQCSCNPYDENNYPPDHPPPISPPYGREDLWDLQFCRWWGWNWVRKREAEATIVARYEEPHKSYPKQMPTKGCESTNSRPEKCCGGLKSNSYESHVSKVSGQPTCSSPAPATQTNNDNISKYSSPPVNNNDRISKCSSQHPQSSARYKGKDQNGCCDGSAVHPPIPNDENQSISPSCGSRKKPPKPPKKTREKDDKESLGHGSLPTKKQFKEMCKCLLGKRQKKHGCCQMAAMANLYRTPSGSRCTMEKLAYGVADRTVLEEWPRCNIQGGRTRRTKRDRACQDKCQVQSWPAKVLEEEELETSVSDEIIRPITAASQKRCSSTEESIEYLSVRLQHIQSDASCPCKKHIVQSQCQTQCQTQSCGGTVVAQAASIHEQIQRQEEPESRFNHQTQTHTPRDHKETQTSPSHNETVRKEEPREQKSSKGGCLTQGACKTGCRTYAEQMYKLSNSKHKTLCIRVCCCGNCKPVISADASVARVETTSCKNNNSTCDNNKNNSNSTKECPVTYPIIVPPSTTKMLSKFGTPSKNYPWMQDIGSDATTTTLNNNNSTWETYKSPASGKTYEFKSIAEFDNRDSSFTLPDLIDITEDLSYLKKIENSTNKSENESRLLLDAVCDAILHEHDERSLDFLEELQADTVTEALQRRYTELETLCDLTRRFKSKSDVHTELSRSYFYNEDIGMNTSVWKGDPDDNIKRMIKAIMENMSVDDPKHKVSTGINPEPVNVNTEPRRNDHSNEFKREDDDVFTRTGLLPSKRAELNKKSIKREAPNSAKNDNNIKKIKHEEASKAKSEKSLKNNRSTEQTNERIGTIYSKIETIVKQSKVKNAEIHKLLGYRLEKPGTSKEISESLLGTVSFSPECSSNETNKTKKNKLDELESSSSKRIYKMSSDAFLGAISPFIPKPSEHKNMRCYDIFSDKLDNLDYSKSCSRIASQIIFEEEIAKSCEDIGASEIDHKNDSVEKKSLEKLSKLSVQSFVLCDEKSSSVEQKPCCSGLGAKRDNKLIKKKKISSKASLIPIRKQSSDGNISKPF